MKCYKLFCIGVVLAACVMPTQAAVYGTLKQDLSFKVEGSQIVKASGTGVSIIDEDELNYVIRLNENTTDSVAKNFIKLSGIITTANKKAAILSDTNSKAKVLNYVDSGQMVMILDKESYFYKVKVDDIVGYICNTSVDETKLSGLEQKSKGEEIIAYAKQFLGGKYVYGGNNLKTGVDCSGFAQQIMKHFNIMIGRSSREQYASSGYKVSETDIAVGDLVFYGYGSVDHVAIYAGNGQVIHANNEQTGIVMSSIHYGKPIIGIKRVI